MSVINSCLKNKRTSSETANRSSPPFPTPTPLKLPLTPLHHHGIQRFELNFSKVGHRRSTKQRCFQWQMQKLSFLTWPALYHIVIIIVVVTTTGILIFWSSVVCSGLNTKIPYLLNLWIESYAPHSLHLNSFLKFQVCGHVIIVFLKQYLCSRDSTIVYY